MQPEYRFYVLTDLSDNNQEDPHYYEIEHGDSLPFYLGDGDSEQSKQTFSMFIGNVLYATVPYICLGAFFVVLTQSTTQGISLSVITYVAEAMVVPPLLAISEKLERINEGLLSSNVREWISLGDSKAAVALKGAEAPDMLQAFLVILAYSVVMLAVSMWLFQRRDLSGAKGE